MQCVRGDGFMVAINLIDIRESDIPMWVKGWRCLSCGTIVGPFIQQHRMLLRAGAMRLLRTEGPMSQLRQALKTAA